MLTAASGKQSERAVTVEGVEVHRCPFPTVGRGERSDLRVDAPREEQPGQLERSCD
jgi:hypothetical protein